MTATSGEMYGVGARRGIVFKLTAAGIPYVATIAADIPYEGSELLGLKGFDLTIPPVRKIVHSGNDRVMAFDFLPAIEGAGATLNVAGRSLALDAMIANVKVRTLGEAKVTVFDSDQQGSEPDVAVLVFQQAKDASTRSRRYRFQLIPKAVISATPPGMADSPAETKYEIAISPTINHLWGTALTLADDGCIEMGVLEGMTEGRPNIVAWLGDGAKTKFLFPVPKPATSTAKIHGVWKNGVIDSSVTKAVDGVTPTVMPTGTDYIVCLYEY